MRTIILAAMLSMLTACAGTSEVPADTQAVRDYVAVGELAEVDRVRTHGSDRWTPLTNTFVLYSGRDGAVLLEFSRECREMFDIATITPDRRYDYNFMRRGTDTLRGCRIDRMYPLTDAQAEEIKTLVENTRG